MSLLINGKLYLLKCPTSCSEQCVGEHGESHKLQHNSQAHKLCDSQLCIKSTTFYGEITTIILPDFYSSNTDKE